MGRKGEAMTATVHQLRGQQAEPAFVQAERFVTKAQLAEHLGFSQSWIDKQLAAGLPCYRIGGRVRFQLSSASAWLISSPSAAVTTTTETDSKHG